MKKKDEPRCMKDSNKKCPVDKKGRELCDERCLG